MADENVTASENTTETNEQAATPATQASKPAVPSPAAMKPHAPSPRDGLLSRMPSSA